MDRKVAWLCLAVFGWWTLNGLAVGAEWMTMRDAAGAYVSWRKAMPASLVGAWGWVPLALGLFWLAQAYPVEPGRIARALGVHALAVLAIVFARAVYIQSLDPWLHWYDAPPAFSKVLLQSVWNNLFQAWLLVGVAHAWVYAGRARQREQQAAQLQSQLAEARLAALASQLNPHFLFNALNSIAELVHRDPDAADRMIVGLAALLRSSLDKAAVAEVPLTEELALVDHYLQIEGIRLGDRLRVHWDVAPEARDALVPPLLLQPLVENAVRHGVSLRVAPGRVRVQARREGGVLVLEVHDDGSVHEDGSARYDGSVPDGGSARAGGASAAAIARGSGASIGLSTTRARLEARYGAAASLELCAEHGGTTARLRLPYRAGRLAA
jgi:signal transduction histidine kinase